LEVSAVIETIRSRGYWEISIRPESHARSRVAYADLESIVRESAVRMRGWPVPMVHERSDFLRGDVWLGQDVDAAVVGHYEAWRIFESGQFAQLRSYTLDWDTEITGRAANRSVIPIWEVVFYLTEVVELAVRLALSPAGDRNMKISASMHGLDGRRVVLNENGSHAVIGQAAFSGETLTVDRAVSREELSGAPRSLAVDLSHEVLARLGLNESREQVADWQSSLLSRA
jgi:hypothetical protein